MPTFFHMQKIKVSLFLLPFVIHCCSRNGTNYIKLTAVKNETTNLMHAIKPRFLFNEPIDHERHYEFETKLFLKY